MDPRAEVREFLTSRRAKITPEQAGLTSYGTRRVPGLRREEVAVLAGVSVPYYTRIERGDMKGVSDSVLDAISRALRLDEAERAHLFNLARALRKCFGSHSRAFLDDQGRGPGGGASRLSIRPTIAHLTIASWVSGSRS